MKSVTAQNLNENKDIKDKKDKHKTLMYANISSVTTSQDFTFYLHVATRIAEASKNILSVRPFWRDEGTVQG